MPAYLWVNHDQNRIEAGFGPGYIAYRVRLSCLDTQTAAACCNSMRLAKGLSCKVFSKKVTDTVCQWCRHWYWLAKNFS